MKDSIQEMLKGITTTRETKYQAEVERQKAEIEKALVEFLKNAQNQYEGMNRACITHQTKNSLWFRYEVDARVLPEVIDYISTEFSLSVDENKNNVVIGVFEV